MQTPEHTTATPQQTATPSPSTLQVQTHLKAGGRDQNHNETLVRPTGLQIQTHLKAGGGGWYPNHNETLVRVSPRQ